MAPLIETTSAIALGVAIAGVILLAVGCGVYGRRLATKQQPFSLSWNPENQLEKDEDFSLEIRKTVTDIAAMHTSQEKIRRESVRPSMMVTISIDDPSLKNVFDASEAPPLSPVTPIMSPGSLFTSQKKLQFIEL